MPQPIPPAPRPADSVQASTLISPFRARVNAACRHARLRVLRCLRSKRNRRFSWSVRLGRALRLRWLKHLRKQRIEIHTQGLAKRFLVIGIVAILFVMPDTLVEKVLDGFVLGLCLLSLAWFWNWLLAMILFFWRLW